MNIFTTRLDDKLNAVLIAAAAALLFASDIGAAQSTELVAEAKAAIHSAVASVAKAPVHLASR